MKKVESFLHRWPKMERVTFGQCPPTGAYFYGQGKRHRDGEDGVGAVFQQFLSSPPEELLWPALAPFAAYRGYGVVEGSAIPPLKDLIVEFRALAIANALDIDAFEATVKVKRKMEAAHALTAAAAAAAANIGAQQ